MGKYNAYKQYKDSGIEWLGDIPEHWKRGTIKRISERVVVGIAEAATYAYVDEGVPILRATNIRENKIIGDILKVDIEYSEDRESKLIKAGDLVTVRTGNAGVTALIPQEFDQSQCFTMLITTLIEKVSKNFYCYFINSQSAKSYFSLQGWGTAQINISVPILKELSIPIPPLNEQKTIAQFLDYKTKQIDDLIAKKEALLERLDEKRTALISHAVTKGLDPNVPMKDSGIEWLGDIPKHWEVKRVKFLVTKIGSGKTPKGGSEIYIDSGIMLIRSQNVYDNGLRLDDVVYIDNEIDKIQANSRVFPNDILLNITGASIGRVSLVPSDFCKANVNQHVCIFRPNIKNIFPQYLHLLLCSQQGKEQIFSYENGTSREGLNFQQAGNLTFAIPSLTEQDKITILLNQKTNEIDQQKAKIKQAIELLKEYRTALITNAVTGKIDVRQVSIPSPQNNDETN